ncbi:1,4-alpha-glucan branching protein GlgB [Paenibacillus sediminis]|uniref:1,4-alpha-glucan branching enzyme GlgB n=1 Tax=Paenibacillus sediminis TaxID=664909 RepID=A0ABS4H0C7_9BACL|nr:1,4-alpha-glucan branching protein GlgB [Paenibacillus sediminis]MBP1935951.1 1,4-alpha-glucan branching enzyme [Paenibacillus sediminis]
MSNYQKANIFSPETVYLFHEGTLYHSYRMLGAHLVEEDNQRGVRFSVWAPNAKHVGIASDFNDWNGDNDPLFKIPNSGIWTRFFPGLTNGIIYKYDITALDGQRMLKADPYAFYAEVRPATASIVQSIEGYEWKDAAWRHHQKAPYQRPLNIYEVHFGTWRQKKDGSFYNYREMADLLIPYVVDMGYTHIEIMPLAEHPYDLSWGYQCTGYFAPTSRYGKPHDLMYFIDRCHQAGIGVILDWVPGHFAKDEYGLRLFDGTPLYEYADSLKAEKPGWGTLTFDYSKPEVRSFLTSNAMYWFDMYHIDGLRVDAVTSMLRLDFEKNEGQWRANEHGGKENLEAVAFLKQLNQVIFHYYPHALMMAEESSAWPKVTAPVHKGGLGFNYKWSMGWMNDTLKYIEQPFEQRPHHHSLLTFPLFYAFEENYTLPLSHDEVVHGKKSLLNKMPGTYEEKFAGLRVLLGYQMTFPGKKLLFMGGEFGQFIEWRDEYELDWLLLDYEMHRKMLAYTKALNQLYLQHKALWERDHEMGGYEWISPHDASQSVISFIRKGKKANDTLHIIINFSPVARENYRIGVAKAGEYVQIFSSADEKYGGAGVGNLPLLQSEKKKWHDRPNSLECFVPPLSITIFKKVITQNYRRKYS